MASWADTCEQAIRYVIEHANDPPPPPMVLLSRDDYKLYKQGGWPAVYREWMRRAGASPATIDAAFPIEAHP